MDLALLKSILLWCVIINYIILLVWFGAISFAHDAVYELHSRWFRIPVEHYDLVMYGGMAVYKLGIFLLNLVPLIALWIVTG